MFYIMQLKSLCPTNFNLILVELSSNITNNNLVNTQHNTNPTQISLSLTTVLQIIIKIVASRHNYGNQFPKTNWINFGKVSVFNKKYNFFEKKKVKPCILGEVVNLNWL